MTSLSRRDMLAVGAAACGAMAATGASAQGGGVCGNPDRPAEGRTNATPEAFGDPGPKNPALASQFSSF